MTAEALISRLPDLLAIPRFAEMRERTRRLCGRSGVEVRVVGEDREGEPIEMVSLGDGPASVLLIGAPHPNEPIGCIGIEWLIEQFASDAGLLRATGCRWHFIKAIEPYALKQNEGWFMRPEVAPYLQHFYRPAFSMQAEYSFPPAGDASWQPVPENEAYQQALRLARPDLLASLHNAEGSGAFYFISRDDEALARRLSAQALARGLPLNLLGEEAPDVREAPLAPGVFLLLDEVCDPALPRELPGLSVTAWLAEQGAQMGPRPLFLVPEVPLFLDRSTGVFASMEAGLDSVAAMALDGPLGALLGEPLDAMAPSATPVELYYVDAIREAVPLSRKLLAELPALKTRARPEHFEAQLRAQVLLALRPLAMARRVAAMRASRTELGALAGRAGAIEQACARELAAALQSPLLRDAFQPVPLRTAVAMQLEAVLATAETVAGLK
ncbi:hypothetical protein [Pelomonas sp. KK5]|uniref:hypothetical protein n=1 Tax=Pelomonas sp. KK5 TaxID=1855730 RepID=UPI00117BF067|nr:hypothetical protein [Pelomonas sp. KK5]